ncbi:MAG: hypothetical protein H6Q69_1693 [Firmicutes bacterium]|nr:hypothetical protein [Bacillota bacterium]
MCYTGYLWECLIGAKCINFKEFDSYRSAIKEVLAFWDIHSKEKIWIPEYWKFGKDTVLKLTFEDLMDNLEYLPEDIYIFDETLQWTLILTHEDVDGERICEKSGNI